MSIILFIVILTRRKCAPPRLAFLQKIGYKKAAYEFLRLDFTQIIRENLPLALAC